MEIIKTNQIIVPKQLYIGDRAELRCTFNSDQSYLRESVLKSEAVKLDLSGFSQNIDQTQYDITGVQLLSSGADYYTLVVSFIPWTTNRIDFPEFDLGLAFNANASQQIIRFDPVNVIALAEGENISLHDAENPLLLPGTYYQLVGGGIFTLALIVILIRLIVKRQQVALFFKNRKLMRKYRKNQKLTEKLLLKLSDDEELSSHDVAEEMQKILRNYLEVRFDYPFTRCLTSELMDGFFKATLHLLSEEKENAFVEIATTFTRTDFIRYSKEASFNGGEKQILIQKIIQNIDIIETPETEKAPDFDEEADKGGENA